MVGESTNVHLRVTPYFVYCWRMSVSVRAFQISVYDNSFWNCSSLFPFSEIFITFDHLTYFGPCAVVAFFCSCNNKRSEMLCRQPVDNILDPTDMTRQHKWLLRKKLHSRMRATPSAVSTNHNILIHPFLLLAFDAVYLCLFFFHVYLLMPITCVLRNSKTEEGEEKNMCVIKLLMSTAASNRRAHLIVNTKSFNLKEGKRQKKNWGNRWQRNHSIEAQMLHRKCWENVWPRGTNVCIETVALITDHDNHNNKT